MGKTRQDTRMRRGQKQAQEVHYVLKGDQVRAQTARGADIGGYQSKRSKQEEAERKRELAKTGKRETTEERDKFSAKRKVRVGKKNKPFLGTRTRKVACWEEGQRELYKYMVNEPSDSPFHWDNNQLLFGLLYRFWMLHNQNYFASMAQAAYSLNVVSIFVGKRVSARPTLEEYRTACYRVRSDPAIAGELIRVLGPAIIPRARIEIWSGLDDKGKAIYTTDYLHRVPMEAILAKQSKMWGRYWLRTSEMIGSSDVRKVDRITLLTINGAQGTYKGTAYVEPHYENRMKDFFMAYEIRFDFEESTWKEYDRYFFKMTVWFMGRVVRVTEFHRSEAIARELCFMHVYRAVVDMYEFITNPDVRVLTDEEIEDLALEAEWFFNIPVVDQLNGSHGEATESDDVRFKTESQNFVPNGVPEYGRMHVLAVELRRVKAWAGAKVATALEVVKCCCVSDDAMDDDYYMVHSKLSEQEQKHESHDERIVQTYRGNLSYYVDMNYRDDYHLEPWERKLEGWIYSWSDDEVESLTEETRDLIDGLESVYAHLWNNPHHVLDVADDIRELGADKDTLEKILGVRFREYETFVNVGDFFSAGAAFYRSTGGVVPVMKPPYSGMEYTTLGAGKGRTFISSKVKNRGANRGSKQRSGPRPRACDVERGRDYMAREQRDYILHGSDFGPGENWYSGSIGSEENSRSGTSHDGSADDSDFSSSGGGGGGGSDDDGEDKEEKKEKKMTAMRKKLISKFLYNPHPGLRTVFLDPNEATKDYDCNGAPFCGLVCVDVACGTIPNPWSYANMCTTKRQIRRPWVKFGSIPFVKDYAFSKNQNLRMITPDQVMDFDNGNRTWIVVKFLPAEDRADNVGHYIIMYGEMSSLPAMQVDDIPVLAYYNWLTSEPDGVSNEHRMKRLTSSFVSLYDMIELSTAFTALSSATAISLAGLVPGATMFWPTLISGLAYVQYRIGRVVMSNLLVKHEAALVSRQLLPCDRDKRKINDRRDPIVYHDELLEVEFTKSLVYDMGFREVTLFELDRSKHMVSTVVFASVYHSMKTVAAVGKDPTICYVELSRTREVNFPIEEDYITGTRMLLEIARAGINVNNVVAPVPRGLVPSAGPGAAAFIPNPAVAAANQAAAAAMKGAGQFNYGFDDYLNGNGVPNHVISYRLEESPNREVVDVGIYPITPLIDSDGLVGPGFYATTNSVNTLAAFVGRGMTKEFSMRDKLVLEDFLEVSTKFLDNHLETVETDGFVFDSYEQYLLTHYRGIRPETWIHKRIDDYNSFLSGQMEGKKLVKYMQNGFFVKFEHNIKEGMPRPRGIMTMSDLMLMECCPIMGAITCWNHSSFQEYQVKGLSMEEKIRKIVEATCRRYAVSDFSAFESSIDVVLRYLEEYVIREILRKAGLNFIWDNYRKYAEGNRELVTKWGRFMISTRCSGDFWTSFGNGIVNVCVMNYCAHKKGIPLGVMLAEGDDGLVRAPVPDVEIISSLGMKFSQSSVGNREGECDFLRSRIVDGKSYLSIGKVICSLLMVKNGHIMKKSTYMSIWRCMAHSIYHLSPGHPVISGLINRIWKETATYHTPRKNIQAHFNTYKDLNISDPGIKRVEVDISMRAEVAQGAIGYAPISIAEQLYLEDMFEHADDFRVFDIFDRDDDFLNCKLATRCDYGDMGEDRPLIDFAKKTPCITLSYTDEVGLEEEVANFKTFRTIV